jgi:hypothetical protein
MQTNNREDETQAKNQHNNRVNPETRALIRVQLEHGAGGATSTGGAG